MAKNRSTSPWIYVGCGCLALILIVIGVVVGGGFVGYSKLSGYVEDLNDPDRRNARALELLGAEELPPGYFTLFFVPIPWVLDFVLLTDAEAANQTLEAIDQEFDPDLLGGHLFFYLRAKIKDASNDLGIRQTTRNGQLFIEVSDQRFLSEEQLDAGTLTLGDQTIEWTAHDGAYIDEGGVRSEGLFSVMEVGCGDQALRSAVWFQRADRAAASSPDGAEAEAVAVEATAEASSESEAVSLPEIVGSPADGDALADFMGHFDLCAK